MRSIFRLTSVVVLVGIAAAWCSSPRQEQPPSPDQQAQGQTQPTANPPAQPVSPATNHPAAPASNTGEKATPPPPPPVLKHRKRRVHRKSAAKTSVAHPSGDPGKVVVKNGGAKEDSAQLTPAVNPSQAKNQRANTASLLAETNANLKRVAGRQLTPEQKGMVDEINAYMQQAKAATAAADTSRAQTLAYKARLLSDELARK